jgi:hypothetical protein
VAILNVTGVAVRLYPAQINQLLKGPQGPVYKAMVVNADLVKAEAKRLVGVHKPVPGERRARRPGTLRDSIVKRPAMINGDIAFIVGSNDPIALIHHEPQPPHIIRPRKPGGLLVFYWPKVGRVVAFRFVHHPGQKGNPYLLNALKVLRGR